MVVGFIKGSGGADREIMASAVDWTVTGYSLRVGGCSWAINGTCSTKDRFNGINIVQIIRIRGILSPGEVSLKLKDR